MEKSIICGGFWGTSLCRTPSNLHHKVRTTHVTGTLTDIGSTLGRLAMMHLRRGGAGWAMSYLLVIYYNYNNLAWLSMVYGGDKYT